MAAYSAAAAYGAAYRRLADASLAAISGGGIPAFPVPFISAFEVGTWILAGMMRGGPPSGVVVRNGDGSVIPGVMRRGASPAR